MFGDSAYPTYQAFLALAIAAAIVLAIMPLWIKLLKHEGIGQQVRADGPERHLIKQGTPTMGGVIMLVAIVLTCILFAKPTLELVLVVLATVATGCVGLVDDMSKTVHERSLGLTPKAKMISLTIIDLVFCLAVVNYCDVPAEVCFPGGFTIDLSPFSTTLTIGGEPFMIPWLYLLFVWLLMAGMSNAVNLTDGLDGLAGGTVMAAMMVMTAISFIDGDVNLCVFCAACAGSCIGFLWYNCYPASIFMGDTGSLALGAAFSSVAVVTNTEVISLVVGALFIVEALSVIIQVVSFKLTGKRVFLMAPIHHHFEKKGWPENRVVIRFWIIAAACGALGFALFFQLG